MIVANDKFIVKVSADSPVQFSSNMYIVIIGGANQQLQVQADSDYQATAVRGLWNLSLHL